MGVTAQGRARRVGAGKLGAGTRSALVTVGGVIALALAAALLVGRTNVNFDSTWALIWGRDLSRADLWTYGGGPTPHPLTIALGAVLTPLGQAGARAGTGIVLGYVAIGLLSFMTFRLTRELSNVVGAIVATALAFANWMILTMATASYLDPLFAALVVTALALEVERPRRGTAPLVVLGIAGLLRPEAWGLAFLYWLYLLPGTSRRTAMWMLVLVAIPPFIWTAMDLAVEGNPLYSLTSTKSAAKGTYGQFSAFENLKAGYKSLRIYLAVPLFVGAAAGAGLLLWKRERKAALPLATFVVMAGLFVFLAVAALPTNPRYLLVPVVLVCVFFGVGAGQVAVRDGSRWLMALGAVLCVVAVVHLVDRADALTKIDDVERVASDPYRDLHSFKRQPESKRILQTCHVTVPTYVAQPYVMYEFDRDSRAVSVPVAGHPPDVLLTPRTPAAVRVLSRPTFGVAPRTKVPPGYRQIGTTRNWTLSLRPGACARRAG